MAARYTIEEIITEANKVVSPIFYETIKSELMYTNENRNCCPLKFEIESKLQYKTMCLVIYLLGTRNEKKMKKLIKIFKKRSEQAVINDHIREYNDSIHHIRTRTYSEYINPILTYIRKQSAFHPINTSAFALDVTNHCDKLVRELIDSVIKEKELQNKLESDLLYID